MSGDFLKDMAQASRERVTRARAQCGDLALQALARAAPSAPRLKLSSLGFDLIAEVKLRSPAIGQLEQGTQDIGARAKDYALAGAAAISVLTEPTRCARASRRCARTSWSIPTRFMKRGPQGPVASWSSCACSSARRLRH